MIKSEDSSFLAILLGFSFFFTLKLHVKKVIRKFIFVKLIMDQNIIKLLSYAEGVKIATLCSIEKFNVFI